MRRGKVRPPPVVAEIAMALAGTPLLSLRTRLLSRDVIDHYRVSAHTAWEAIAIARNLEKRSVDSRGAYCG